MIHNTHKRVALVHDYIKEFGGAERVLKVLIEMYPNAPIYTAFTVKGSTAQKEFPDAEIHESWLAPILKIWKLYSPLRFLIPLIWGSLDLSKYDLVITSCSWYITRGFKIGPHTKVIAYCHTPPRWLYGYETSVGFTKYWPVKIYASIVGHFLRQYDFKTAQMPYGSKQKAISNKQKITAGVDLFIANSANVKRRIDKFYKRDSVVIYPPVDTESIKYRVSLLRQGFEGQARIKGKKDKKYFLIVSRLVGAKGIENAVDAFSKLDGKYKLKIVGEAAGYSDVESRIKEHKFRNIEFMGRVSDEKLWELYSNAKGFIALAKNEDFGMTAVEAQAAGCPVIAYNGGGFKESVVDEITGLFVNSDDTKSILNAIKRFEKIKWNRQVIMNNAKRFSKEKFVKEIKKVI